MAMSNFWKKLFQAGSNQRRRPAEQGAASVVHIERFETRCLLSVSSVFNATTGALSISSNGKDAIAIGAGTDGNVTLNGATLSATANGVAGPVSAIAVKTLSVTGGSGNNAINLSGVSGSAFTMLSSVSIDGGAGNDSITGSALADNIQGGAGKDTLSGLGGNDSLSGGVGNDVLNGGDDNDAVDGGDGTDSLDGGAGNDVETGGTGKDTLTGGAGNDSLSGGAANDQLSGGDGQDTLDGGDANDSLDGGAGNDTELGGLGNDTLQGGDGDDSLSGGDNNDNIQGGILPCCRQRIDGVNLSWSFQVFLLEINENHVRV